MGEHAKPVPFTLVGFGAFPVSTTRCKLGDHASNETS